MERRRTARKRKTTKKKKHSRRGPSHTFPLIHKLRGPQISATKYWNNMLNYSQKLIHAHKLIDPDIPVNPNSWVSGSEPRTGAPAEQPKQILGYLAKMIESTPALSNILYA